MKKEENAMHQHQFFFSFHNFFKRFPCQHNVSINPELMYNQAFNCHCIIIKLLTFNQSNNGTQHSYTQQGKCKFTSLTLYPTIPTLKRKVSENIMEKGENAGNQHFLLFQQCFLCFQRQIPLFYLYQP